jgi:hypothetical protein
MGSLFRAQPLQDSMMPWRVAEVRVVVRRSVMIVRRRIMVRTVGVIGRERLRSH